MVGFLSNDAQVGFFVAGTKINHVAITLIGSMSVVLIPRCSNLLEKHEYSKFSHLINKSLQLNLALSYPMMGGLFMLASALTYVFCGPEYGNAIPVMLCNIPVILLINITSMTGLQILYPVGKINVVIVSVIAGACVNILLNLLLVPKSGGVGAAISTTITEFIVFIVQIYLGRQYFPFNLSKFFNIKYIIGTLVMCFFIYLTSLLFQDNIPQVFVGILIGVLVYILTMYLFHDEVTRDLLDQISQILKKQNQ